ncbi:MAG: macro domain-containing protein [Alphaproteobacteria bacterium]|jgi:hypothetical protein
MKIKVNFLSYDLITQFFAKDFAFANTVLSLLLMFFDNFKDRVSLGIVFLIGMFLWYCYKWKKANKLRQIKLTINNSTVEIFEGDLFKQNGIKIVAFNEYLDTEVSDKVISETTLNGKYLKYYAGNITKLNQNMDKCSHLKEMQCGKESNRKNGKVIKYKLGTIFVNDDFFLVAFSHFDKDNRAWITMPEYTSCLLEMWNEVDKFYNGKTVVLPIIGSGITRFKEGYLSTQELLEILLWSLKLSKLKFKYPSTLQIIIHKDDINKINLYKIKQEFN